MTEKSQSRTVQAELPEEQLDVIHELVLRGLRETDPADREYGEAYDAFVESVGYPLRIGDQPNRVQEVWQEIFESDPQECPRCGSDRGAIKDDVEVVACLVCNGVFNDE